MIRLKKVLAVTDFSECSERAVRYACEFTEVFSAELHLLNIVEITVSVLAEFGVSHDGLPAIEQELLNKAQSKLEQIPSAHWEQTLSITRFVGTGTPFMEIIRYARNNEIDLIVAGTHGRGPISHMLMGSTAEKLVRKAPCPVMTVRPEGHTFVLP